MPLVRMKRTHYAVYWAPVGNDEEGQPTYEGPVEIRCRWDDTTVQYKDYRGRDTVSRAIVYPDRALVNGGVLWRGRLTAVEYQAEPFRNKACI
jgi:hypothetical protein